MFSCVVFPGSFRKFIPKTLRYCFSQIFTSFCPLQRWYVFLVYIIYDPSDERCPSIVAALRRVSLKSDGEMSHLNTVPVMELQRVYILYIFLNIRYVFFWGIDALLCFTLDQYMYIYVSQFILSLNICSFGNTFGIKTSSPSKPKLHHWNEGYFTVKNMAQNLKGRLVENPYKPVRRDCAMYFSLFKCCISWIGTLNSGFL